MNARIIVWAVPVLLFAGPVGAVGDLERAQAEFVCEPDEVPDRDGVEDDLFDEQSLPTVVTDAFGSVGASSQSDAQSGSEEGAPTTTPELDAELNEAELQAWRDAVTRYEDRALEFAGAVNRIIRRKYSEEMAELRDGYEHLIGRADIEERQLRDAAIGAHERFIKEHPDSAYTGRRMFRLAELYFEKADEQYLFANETYSDMELLFDEGKLDFLPEPPEKDLRKSIVLYKKIIRKFPDYDEIGAVYYMLGYCYSDESSRHLDPERAEAVYLGLLENVESSPYRAQAYFRLGDIYFEENQLERALYYYRTVVEEFEETGAAEFESGVQGRLYELALYKLAWAYYKVDDLDVAVDRFMTLLAWSERKEARTGVEADLKPEAVRYLAISFSDQALESDSSPIDFALAALTSRRDEPWAFSVLVELATILKDQARFEEAISAYYKLQELRPLDPMGPEFQNSIIVLYQNLVVPDPDAAARARIELTNRYGLRGEWFEVNKNNKDATASATRYILESLQWVAYAYHARAQKSGDPNDYLLAANKYLEYLDSYPFAENAYELNYYLADCYFWVGGMKFQAADGDWTTGWSEAIKQYASLFGFPEEDYRKDAILGIMFSYNYLWKQTSPDISQTPEALATIQPPLGQQVEYSTVAVTELEQNYVRSVRWVEREVPEYDGLAVLLYDIGQIYYYKNHLRRARTTYLQLIESHPATDYASFAAGHIVDSYRFTGDLARMREYTERFAMLDLGQDEILREERNALFSTLAKQSLFKDGEIHYGLGRFECALLGFLEYYDLYGAEGTDDDPQQIDDIIYNIALSYSKVGRAADSTRYYEILLNRFPHSEQAPNTFWKMAQNFEQLFELDKAVGYYKDLMKFHPGHDDVPNALYNSGFLAIGLERFADAARAYEDYHDTYTEKEESPLLLYRAAELWEADNNTTQARRVYSKWLTTYGETDADRWVETKFKLAGFARDANRNREADRLLADILESYELMRSELIQNGGSIGLMIVAELAFQPLVAEYEAYASIEIPNSTDADVLQEAVDRKISENTRIAGLMDDFVVQYPDFEWQTAALYYKALSFRDHGLTWLNAPNPFDGESDDLDEVDRYFMFVDIIVAKAQPFEDTANQLFTAVVAFAKEKKRYTEWVGKALEELSKIDPNAYPVPKPEETTVIPSDSATLPAIIETVENES
jgi:tetratricopeptide (TPR) repeat protein